MSEVMDDEKLQVISLLYPVVVSCNILSRLDWVDALRSDFSQNGIRYPMTPEAASAAPIFLPLWLGGHVDAQKL